MKGLPIISQRLILRPVEQGDLESIWEACQCPGLADGLRWEPPSSKDELSEQVGKEYIGGDWYPLVIAEKNGSFVGRCFLNSFSGPWSIGYWLLPKHRGKGYALEASQALLHFAFHELNADKVFANSCLWNDKSTNLLLKLGMRSLGVKKGGLKKSSGEQDVEEFVIDKKVYFSNNSVISCLM